MKKIHYTDDYSDLQIYLANTMGIINKKRYFNFCNSLKFNELNWKNDQNAIIAKENSSHFLQKQNAFGGGVKKAIATAIFCAKRHNQTRECCKEWSGMCCWWILPEKGVVFAFLY